MFCVPWFFKRCSFTTVHGKNTIVYQDKRSIYGRIWHRIRSFATVYGVGNCRPGYLIKNPFLKLLCNLQLNYNV
jgi:hypothetical protein